MSTNLYLGSFSLPLACPLPVGHQTLTSREGYWFAIEDQDGFRGVGEVIPLPGMHKETLVQARTQLMDLLPVLRRSLYLEFLDSSVFGMAQAHQKLALMHEQYECWKLYPSVRFALDMALLCYLARRSEQTLCHFLAVQSDRVLPVQALLSGTTESMLSLASQRSAQGYRAFKVKLGRQSLQDDIQCVHSLRGLLGSAVIVRLDANRSWSWEQATTFVQETATCAWEYVEEPLREPKALPHWYEKTGAAVALDESLGWGEETSLLPDALDSRCSWIHTLILKPHVLGGWIPTQRWIEWAQLQRKQVVFSDSFGSGLGRIFLAHWAAALAQGTPVGLDTERWFAQDMVPSIVHHGHIDLEKTYQHILAFQPTPLVL